VMSLCLKTIPYLVAGLHRRSWSNLTFRDLGGLVALGAFVAFVGTLLLVIFGAQLGIPRSIAVLDSVITVMLMSAVRALARYRHEQFVASVVGPDYRKRVLVIGAGEAGALTVRELLRHPETGMRPVGFLDDDRNQQGQ